MPLSLSSLPYDILIYICVRLDPRDLLAVIQTCRVLHALAFSDYVWHHINLNLPLDLSSSRDGRLCNLPASRVKEVTVRALRLDVNWRRQASHILRIDKIEPSHISVDIQPLGANWLVTSHRVRRALLNICVWQLGTRTDDSSVIIPLSCIIRIKPENAFTFEAAFQEEGSGIAIISVLGASQIDNRKGQLTIYRIDLEGHQTNENPLGMPYIMDTWTMERDAMFYYTQISGPIIAAAIVSPLDIPTRHRILLVNIQTKTSIEIDLPLLWAFDSARMRFKLYSPFIVIAGVYRQRIKVHVRELPKVIFSPTTVTNTTKEDTPSEDWAASIVDYETEPIRAAEIHISPEPIYTSTITSFTVFATYSPFSSMENGIANVYHFPVDTTARNVAYTNWPFTLTFFTPSNVTLEPMCLGKTGLRAVWLSHQWNTNGYKLMRASFPAVMDEKAVVKPLQAPDIALPFEPHTCHSLYFEEATCKVWVGVHTGEIFVLQF